MTSAKFIKRLFVSIFMMILWLGVFSVSWAQQREQDDEVKYLPPIISWLLNGQRQAPSFSSGAFIEQNGLIVVEMESLDAPTGWTLKNDDIDALGEYLEWTDGNSLQMPGNGVISLKVVIENPGTYQFIWRSSIREGEDTTDANDSFLKILADNFYGFRASDNSTVCPRDQAASNRCLGRDPEGASRDGWFKVYRSGGPAIAWVWRSSTSDNDAHAIYADFDFAGEYEIQISGRSMSHAIDRFVMFRTRNLDNNVTQNFATDSARNESATVP